MQLQKVMKSVTVFMKRIICRYVGNIALMLMGLCVLGFISVVISDFDTKGHGKVYAVDFSADAESGQQEIQSGLMGVLNGVANMERYSDATRLLSVADTNEEVLAGVGRVNRRAIHRKSIGESTKTAGQVGYYAQQAVYENQMSEEDYYSLLQIVEAEATGGDIMSKMMVAGVVLNRVRDGHFPDSIYEVIWEREQFQPTQDGRISSVTVTEETEEAVDRVLQGEDYTQGALFFFSREDADADNVTWFDSSLVKIFEYGGHEYFTFKDYVSAA